MQAPLFTVKSKLFAKSTFVIGYDTVIRLIMPKYYGSEAKISLELAAMHYRGYTSLWLTLIDLMWAVLHAGAPIHNKIKAVRKEHLCDRLRHSNPADHA